MYRQRAFRMFFITFILLAGLVTSIELTVSSAWATFPGTNGKIVFESDRDGNHEIYVMDADGSDQTRLTNSADDDGDPCWSADGSKIAWDRQNGDRDTLVMDANGSDQTNVGDDPADDGDPCWSPDGSEIVFESERVTGNHEIWAMNADGTGAIDLTNHPNADRNPNWSPDGTKIVFETNRDGNREIYVMDVNGSNQINLTNDPAQDELPNWSPDGSKIVFQRNVGGNDEVFVMLADGTGQTNLSNNPASDIDPNWSPDGTKIVLASNRDDNGDGGLDDYEIYSMSSNGIGVPAKLTDNDDLDVRPDWQPLQLPSPVGGEILGIDITTLFIAGAAANASWIIPIAGAAAAGILGFALRKGINRNKG